MVNSEYAEEAAYEQCLTWIYTVCKVHILVNSYVRVRILHMKWITGEDFWWKWHWVLRLRLDKRFEEETNAMLGQKWLAVVGLKLKSNLS